MAPTDDGPKEALSLPEREPRKFDLSSMKLPVAVIAIAALIAAFGGGYITAKGVDGSLFSRRAETAAKAEGVSWPLFGKPRAASARRAPPPKPSGFAVWRNRVDTSGPEPLACIEMSRPLDASKSYSDFVLVSPDIGGTPAVTVRGASLCIGGLGFVDRRITLLKGLPGAGGLTLAQNADVDFTFGERPPYVGFAGDGVVLPREEADGVGIETINVSKLQVEVWRVTDRNLVRKEITVSSPAGEGDYLGSWGDDYPNDEGRRIWKGEVAVQGESGQRVTTVFPLGAVLRDMQPGGYIIKARDISGARSVAADESGDDSSEYAQARRWIIFTDMALTAYTGSDGLDVVVRSLKTARTVSGVRVALVARNGEDLAEARSDASGRVRFARPLLEGENAQYPKMLMAYGAQGDLALLDLQRSPVDLSKQGVGGRIEANAGADLGGRTAAGVVDSYLYADRGIYRPGETMHLVALMRDREASAVKDRKGALVVLRPSGVEFKRIAFDRNAGVVAQDVALPRTAPRGRWSAKVEIEGVKEPVGQMSFSVEDFAPQRLAVDAQGQAERPITAGETRAVEVIARFLYGAPGAGLQAQAETRTSVDANPFPQFEGYRFGDDQTPFQEQVTDPITTVTDGAGRAVLNVPASMAGESAAPLKALVTTAVFEPGGRPVRESLTLKLRTRPVYYGVKIDQEDSQRGDTPVALNIISVGADGRRVAAQNVTWTLIAEHWDYDWFQQNGRWQWRRTSRDVIVERKTGAISSTAALRYARRLQWGDYRVVVESPDGAKAVIKFSAGWGSPTRENEAPDQVRVSAGTGSHVQGDTVQMTIKSPYAGEAQVAVATDRLIDFKTLRVGPNGATVSFKTSQAWGGGAYVMVTVIQPRDPADTPKPRRAIGLTYVSLDPKGRRLAVDLGVPARQGAKAPVSVPVKVNGLGFGQRARVTVAAVDEGILRLTKFDSPDPVKWYFGKRALTVDYRDDYGRLLDPNLGAPANVNFGADQIGGEGLTVTPIRTVALWSGVVETGLDGRATVNLPAADFNGELRLMAVAWTDNAVGSGSKAMTVREPVVAELNLPRFLAPGDRVQSVLELHNLDGRPGDYTAEVTGSGGIATSFKRLFALVVGQRTTERIEIAAPSSQSISNIAFKVTGPGFTTQRAYPIQTRLGWGPEMRATTALQRPGEAFTPAPALMQGLTAGSVTMQVSYSPFQGFDPAAVALALSRYPYGCTEQLVSVAYPLLYAAKFTSDPRVRRSTPALNEAVGKLLDRQTLDGAFGLWRVGDGEADAWLGAYITDFLVEAKAQGAPVPEQAVDRALNAMRLISKPDGWLSVSYRQSYPQTWMGKEEASAKATQRMRSRASAYALYVMAKAGRGDLARLRWWHDVQMKTEVSPMARAQVAAGLALMGDKARARSALRQAAGALGYRDESDMFQSPLRDLAAVVNYAYEAGEPEFARSLQGRLDGTVRDPDRLNTQEQARLLQVAYQMTKAAGPVNVTATGATALATASGGPRWAVGRLADARFVNAGSGPVYRTVTVRGVPTTAPAAAAEGMSVGKAMWSLDGSRVDPGSVTQGQRVIVQLSGVSRQGRSLMMVVDDALPAGFEIETLLGPDDAQNGPFRFLGDLSTPNVQEARDDRYVASLTLEGNKPYTLAYIARAVTPGSFFLPGAEARDMYRPSVFGRSAGGRLAIAAGP